MNLLERDINNLAAKGAQHLLHGRILSDGFADLLFRATFLFLGRGRRALFALGLTNCEADSDLPAADLGTRFAQSLRIVRLRERVARVPRFRQELKRQLIAFQLHAASGVEGGDQQAALFLFQLGLNLVDQ